MLRLPPYITRLVGSEFGRVVSSVIRLVIGLAFSLSISSAQAMWAKPDPNITVQDSVLIIEAKLVDVFKTNLNNRPTTLGLLSIKKHYKGTTNQPLITIQLPNSSSPLLSSDIHYKIGTSGLWLLNINQNGLLSANHPQRFVPMEQSDSILKRLNQSPK